VDTLKLFHRGLSYLYPLNQNAQGADVLVVAVAQEKGQGGSMWDFLGSIVLLIFFLMLLKIAIGGK
jgi:hypothetical protein